MYSETNNADRWTEWLEQSTDAIDSRLQVSLVSSPSSGVKTGKNETSYLSSPLSFPSISSWLAKSSSVASSCSCASSNVDEPNKLFFL